MEETNETTPTPVEETTAPVVDVEIKAPVEETVATAHDDFDWSVDKRNVTSYTADEKAKYDTVYDNTFKQIADGEMIQATVESLTKTDAVVNNYTYDVEKKQTIVNKEFDETDEALRIMGYGCTPDFTFNVKDVTNPTQEEVNAWSKLSPAQKISWLKANSVDAGIFNYINTGTVL